MAPKDQVTAMGADGLGEQIRLAYEIQTDAAENGKLLTNGSFSGKFTPAELKNISELVEALYQLPREALQRNPERSLNHPSWLEIRKIAKSVLESLQEKTEKYRAYHYLPENIETF